ncbi:hypothetical protein F5X68DRAFT_241940 [Plectosphaerella plurivora]|uniref:LysM domain-containing protein n=1 Tax=Plectosphaerella plurivora TaxID=936078 RepID=A0A9P9A8U1_9PEZI|nr:hypothetical protein F5X68DRAFT_241940 [Plectosphaerella plurivora]
MLLSFKTPTVKAWLAALFLAPAVLGQTSTPGGPVHPGQPANCNGWHTIVSGDNCSNVPQKYGITLTQFLAWNPAVSSDCQQNFWLESAYCVRPDDCNGWHTIVSGDNCNNVPERYGITLAQFLAWNPAVSSDCVSNFWLESAYCVRTGAPVGGTTTTGPTTSAPTTTAVTTSFNSTYSTQWPVTSWNLTTISVETIWPPTKKLEGEAEFCDSWHLARPGDTCQRMVSRYGISLSDFISWNPAAEEDCDELIASYRVCVGAPGAGNTNLEWQPAQPEETVTAAPDPTDHVPTALPPIDSTFIPSPSHGPMPANCRNFHQAGADENCDTVVAQYGYITRDQFLLWNPALDGNCQGLWLDTYYCVGAYDEGEFPLPPSRTERPTSGTIPHSTPWDCARWYETHADDTCELIVAMFASFTLDQFIAWNPTVKADCSGIIGSGAWYCIGLPDTPTTRTDGAATPTEAPSTRPTQSGVVSGCTDFWLVGSDENCDAVAIGAGISLDNLFLWNSQLGETDTGCSGIEADYYVCVGVESTATSAPGTVTTRASTTTAVGSTTRAVTTTSVATTTSAGTQPVTTPQPVREGMTPDCVRFYLQQPGDLCWYMASTAGITLEQFYEWNPAVGVDCPNLWPDYYYCIGVSGPATTISQGPPVPT